MSILALKGAIAMKLQEIMTQSVVKIHPEESVATAARHLTHYNIGMLPVCDQKGALCGVVTDRDLVTRCLATGRRPEDVKVREVMTGRVVSADPNMEAGVAAHLMGKEQIRRLPVCEKNGKLCGMVSLADLARQEECGYDAADALTEISSEISNR